jgi:multimeric flavodoxin WrbA
MDARETTPEVVAIVGSPRPGGNTAYAVALATAELERLGMRTRTIRLCGCSGDPREGHTDCAGRGACASDDDADELLDLAYAADGLILATPVYFCNVSAQMKAFMDRTNGRYLRREWMTPKAVGLVVIGAQGGLSDTVHALRRYLEQVAPSDPPVEVATGHADAIGDAEGSAELREQMLRMASRLAERLLQDRAAGCGAA